jgi:hypothetical protein
MDPRLVLSIVTAAIAIVLLVYVFKDPVIRWWDCQQLAPVERLFTRGC